jgi:hypothetical protein
VNLVDGYVLFSLIISDLGQAILNYLCLVLRVCL